MLKRLIQWIKSLFVAEPRKPEPASASSPSLPTSPAQVPGNVTEVSTEAQWEAYRNSFVPTTRAFIPTWERKLEIERQIAENARSGAGPDRSGFVLNAANGYLVHPPVIPGKTYRFVLDGPGNTVRVFGVGGDQLTHINGQLVSDGHIPRSGDTIDLTVNGIGLGGKIRLGVQLVP